MRSTILAVAGSMTTTSPPASALTYRSGLARAAAGPARMIATDAANRAVERMRAKIRYVTRGMPTSDAVRVIEIDDVIPKLYQDQIETEATSDTMAWFFSRESGRRVDGRDQLRRLQPRRVPIQQRDRVLAVAADGVAAAAAVHVLRQGRRAVQAAAADPSGHVHAERRRAALTTTRTSTSTCRTTTRSTTSTTATATRSSSTRLRRGVARALGRIRARAQVHDRAADLRRRRGQMIGFDGKHYHASMHPEAELAPDRDRVQLRLGRATSVCAISDARLPAPLGRCIWQGEHSLETGGGVGARGRSDWRPRGAQRVRRVRAGRLLRQIRAGDEIVGGLGLQHVDNWSHEFVLLRPQIPANHYRASKSRTPENDARFVSESSRCLTNEPENMHCAIADSAMLRPWPGASSLQPARDRMMALQRKGARDVSFPVELAAVLRATGDVERAQTVDARIASLTYDC